MESCSKGRLQGHNQGFWKRGSRVTVNVKAFNPESPAHESITGFVESKGFVSIESAHYAANVSAGPTRGKKSRIWAPRYPE